MSKKKKNLLINGIGKLILMLLVLCTFLMIISYLFFSLVYHITNYSQFQGHWFKDSRSFDKCVQFCLISRIWNIDSIDFYSLSIIHKRKYILIIFLRTIGNIYAPSLEEGSVSKLWLQSICILKNMLSGGYSLYNKDFWTVM